MAEWRGSVQTFFSCEARKILFMNEKGKDVVELSDEKRLRNFVLLRILKYQNSKSTEGQLHVSAYQSYRFQASAVLEIVE
jgi:hypothetical protein